MLEQSTLTLSYQPARLPRILFPAAISPGQRTLTLSYQPARLPRILFPAAILPGQRTLTLSYQLAHLPRILFPVAISPGLASRFPESPSTLLCSFSPSSHLYPLKENGRQLAGIILDCKIDIFMTKLSLSAFLKKIQECSIAICLKLRSEINF